MRHRGWIHYTLGALTCAWACVNYNPAFESTAIDSNTDDVDTSSADIIPCSDPDEVRILVENFAFEPQCGCVETDGNSCTTKVGVKVIWTFADPEVHNVASDTGSFNASGDTSAGGSFEIDIDEPGEYPYGCTIHSEMRGYTIIAQ